MMILAVLAWLSVAAWVYRDAQHCADSDDQYPAIKMRSPAAWSLQAILLPGLGWFMYLVARRTTGDAVPSPTRRWQVMGTPLGALALLIGGFLMGSLWSGPNGAAIVAASTMPLPSVTSMAWAQSQRLTATQGDMRYAVLGHSRTPAIHYGTGATRASGQFVIVKVALRNVGRESQVLMPTSFALVDTSGRRYATSFSGETALLFQTGRSLMLEPLGPGYERVGDLVFDLPETLSHLSLAIVGPESLVGTVVLPVS